MLQKTAYASRIKKNGGEGMFIKTDVSSEGDVAALVAKTLSAYGRLDAAFNNAGIEGEAGKQTHEQSVENYRAVMDINVLGVLLAMKHEVSAMLRNGGGAIVNNSSVAGLIGFPGVGVYVASKHAVIGLTKIAALEYATEGTRVNAVRQGALKPRCSTASPVEAELTLTARLRPCTRLGAQAGPTKSPKQCCGSVRTRRRSSRANRSPWMAAGRQSNSASSAESVGAIETVFGWSIKL